MKHLKKMMALALAIVMTLAMGVTVFADTVDSSYNQNTHTITITNTDQNVVHTYEAYRVFAGHLDKDGQGTKLGNIVWGEGVNGADILTALKASNVDTALTNTTGAAIEVAAAQGTPGGADYVEAKTIASGESLFKYCESAADVAEVISKFTSTGSWKADGTANTGFETMAAGQIDAFATIVAGNLATKAADFTPNETTYTAEVTGDGYYFVKDVTTTLTDDDTTASDTKSKYLLAVVKDTEIVAKDTGIEPDKKILGTNNTKLAADSAAIGDTATFEVTVEVPNTYKYEDHFVFNMNDKLPAGMTFTGITSVTVGSTTTATLTDATKLETKPYAANGYDGTAGYYTLKINDAAPTMDATDDTKYVWEPTTYDAVAAAGGQKVTIVFNEFKKFVEKNSFVGGTNKVTITYTAVVNDDATYTKTANENEVTFVYSNDPNHDYNGDEITGTDPKGETPKSKTRTYTTTLQILKVDDNNQPLANAIFELSGNALNRTVLTGVKYEKAPYEAKIDEVVDSTDYWLLKNGSYTTTDPNGTGVNQSVYATPLTDKYVKVTYTTDEIAAKATTLQVASGADGIIKFTGLNEGEYTLKEIAAPDGFNKIEGTSTINITWSDPEATDAESPAKDQGGFTLTANGFAENTTFVAANNQFEVTIENKSGTQLPSTGGIGTTIFYVIGAILVIGAGVLLVTRRRMNAN